MAGCWRYLVKDPGKIRGAHPTIVFFDEAAHIENFREAFTVALLTKVPKMLAVTTAYPGDCRDNDQRGCGGTSAFVIGDGGRRTQDTFPCCRFARAGPGALPAN